MYSGGIDEEHCRELLFFFFKLTNLQIIPFKKIYNIKQPNKEANQRHLS